MKSKKILYKQVGALSLLTICSATTFAQNVKKNILFLMADDFSYWTHIQGYYPQAKTPNIDKLATKGIMFTDAHCASPVSNPSRNAMWSGFRASTTGIQSNSDGFIREKAGFANIITMNQYFKEHGYWVYGAGKMYHQGSMADGPSIDQSNWSQRNTGNTGCNGGTYVSWSNPGWSAMIYGVNNSTMTESNCNDFKLVNDVSKFLTDYPSTANKDKPFFIGCGVFRPHLPWKMPKQFWNLFSTDSLQIPKGYKDGDLSDVPWNSPESSHTSVVAAGKWKESIHAYLASLALADYNIGILLNALDKSPYKDNTIVCFLGDHGLHSGEKEKWGKNTFFDAANRTTLIIYDPSATGNGKFCSKVVSLQDLYPTLVELSGLPLKTDMEGNSLVPLLDNPERADWDKPILTSYLGTDYIKTNNWRYVRDPKTTEQMLYDVKNDPYEFTNLRYDSQYASVVTKLSTQMDSILAIGLTLRTKLLANYKFTPNSLSIPGIIEAEDYDEGGYNQTYYDVDKINSGGMYRTGDGADIYVTDDGNGSFHLADLATGDWYMYSISDFIEGKYTVNHRVKNNSATPAVIQLYNHLDLLGELNIPANINTWQTLSMPEILLNKGTSARIQLKVKNGDGLQINWLEFISINTENPEIRATIKRKCLDNTIVKNGIMLLDLTNTDPIAQLTIYDVKGKQMLQEFVSGEQKLAYHFPILVSKGVYLLKVSDKSASSVEKFKVE